MPTRRPSKVLSRSLYARTSGDFLTGGVDPASQQPIWWYGSDAGGGAFPIGPNGPWVSGQAPAQPVVVRATSLITGPLTSAPFRVLELGLVVGLLGGRGG